MINQQESLPVVDDRVRSSLDFNSSSVNQECSDPPRVNEEIVQRYWQDMERVLLSGQPEDVKKLVRTCVSKIRMAPEKREVEITYRVPEPVMNCVVAGARISSIHERLSAWSIERWQLPTRGKRSDLIQAVL
jgi:hypothetical protein